MKWRKRDKNKYMDKLEFLQACSEYGGMTRVLHHDYGQPVIDTYNKLLEDGEIALFRGIVCLVAGKLQDDVYELIPCTAFPGIYRDLNELSVPGRQHYWRAEKKECHICGKTYFASTEDDTCPYCVEKK